MSVVAKYLLTLCILFSGYIHLTAHTRIEAPLNNHKGSPSITLAIILRNHPCIEAVKAASSNAQNAPLKADLIESEVEEEEIVSKKQVEKYYDTTSLLSDQIRSLSLANGSTLPAHTSFSRTSSSRYLLFQVFRI